MKHKTWFRLVLKAIGIYLLCTAIPVMLNQASMIALNWPERTATRFRLDEQWRWVIPQTVYSGTQLGLGLYLLLGGRWMVDKIIPSNRSYCAECGYPLAGDATRCPECGTIVPGAIGKDAGPDQGAQTDG